MDRRTSLNRISQFVGLALTYPALSGILNGCAERKDAAMTPLKINKKQRALIAELSDDIIPRTDTPGAKDAGVPEFIELLINDVFLKQDSIELLTDLEKFNTACKTTTGHNFIDCNAEQRIRFLTEVTNNTNNSHDFFVKMNGLVVSSYFTSEVGMRQGLNYVPIPGKFEGCTALEADEKIMANDRL